jgi:hypothetical protein
MIRAGQRPVQRLLGATLLMGWAMAAHAQGEAAVMKRAGELREAPAESARSLAPLSADSAVTRLGERQGPWIQVRNAAGATGWVHMFDVAPQSSGGNAGSGALRGVTNFFNKGNNRPVTTATSTIGIRGLGAEDLAQAQPNLGAVTQMEALRQSESQARAFAGEAALVSVPVEPLPAPALPAAAPNQGQSQ